MAKEARREQKFSAAKLSIAGCSVVPAKAIPELEQNLSK